MSNELLAALLIGFLGSGHFLVMCGGIVGALQLAMPAQSTTKKLVLQLTLLQILLVVETGINSVNI